MGGWDWDRDRQSGEAATQIGQRDIFGRRRAENYWGEMNRGRRNGKDWNRGRGE